ncbi:hypothetical protein AAMO2058_001696700 [Amorphochlora amoebiformis]|uniref:Uncharacterized protein n=1 Tax=Amorphochlora amoebiformis TaxID=1561963 RepID=A0A7S0H747_9EUKA|mmetsp:Transcript_9030/g.14274  ORF Transcript_9030/g.14274 Transcript_9030/m.14274 type:complete len:201 (+) Transcript_9030:60-662(+)
MQVCREIGLTDWGSLKTKRNRDHLGAGESLGTHQREESESSSLVKAHGIERYYYSLTGGPCPVGSQTPASTGIKSCPVSHGAPGPTEETHETQNFRLGDNLECSPSRSSLYLSRSSTSFRFTVVDLSSSTGVKTAEDGFGTPKEKSILYMLRNRELDATKSNSHHPLHRGQTMCSPGSDGIWNVVCCCWMWGYRALNLGI